MNTPRSCCVGTIHPAPDRFGRPASAPFTYHSVIRNGRPEYCVQRCISASSRGPAVIVIHRDDVAVSACRREDRALSATSVEPGPEDHLIRVGSTDRGSGDTEVLAGLVSRNCACRLSGNWEVSGTIPRSRSQRSAARRPGSPGESRRNRFSASAGNGSSLSVKYPTRNGSRARPTKVCPTLSQNCAKALSNTKMQSFGNPVWPGCWNVPPRFRPYELMKLRSPRVQQRGSH